MAKYKIKELVDENDIMSHVFLNCMAEDHGDKLRDIANRKPKAMELKEVEIELTIDGISVNPRHFFELYQEQYTEQLRKAATKIVNEQVSERFNKLIGELSHFEQITESWAKEINWTVPNPLVKEA